MDLYKYWEKHGVFLSVNLVVVSFIVMLMVSRAWSLSGTAVLILIVADTLVVNRIRHRSETPGHVYAGGRFFRLYGYALAVGGLIWLVLRMREGIRWVDLAPLLIVVLLAVAMFSIARKMRRG